GAGMNLIETSDKNADATAKIESLKEELLSKGYSEELLANLIPEEVENQCEVTLGEMQRILHRRAKKPKLDD
ncbi:hypothetical protein Tco_1521749, partial [Tanacetum coccineum]